MKLNLRNISNKRFDTSSQLYFNSKTLSNSTIKKNLTTSNFINNNYSTISNYANQKTFKKNEIKIQKKKLDQNKKTKTGLYKGNIINYNKRSGLLNSNLNISSFKSRLMKSTNKSGVILNKNIVNKIRKNKTKNIIIENKLNKKFKEFCNKKIIQGNINKNKRNEISLNFYKDKSSNNKSKNYFVTENFKFQSFFNNKINNKKSYKNNKIIYNRNYNPEIKKNKNNLNNNQNSLQINNFINYSISYINNLNNEKKIKKGKYITSINSELLPLKEKINYSLLKANVNINNKLINSKKNSTNSNLLNEKRYNDIKNKPLNLNAKFNNLNEIFEKEIEEKSQIDTEIKSKKNIENSKEDSGLLSFEKIEDLIIYYNMKEINKKDNFLFFKDDKKKFKYRYLKNLNQKFFDSF